jgi:hypothetical protein
MDQKTALPAPEVTVRARFEELKRDNPSQALNFLVHALPRLEAIYWAAGTIMAASQSSPPPTGDQQATREAIRSWLEQQDERTRRLAYDRAQAIARDLPERSLAGAIFYSGGSIAPADAAPILPIPGLANRLAATAVLQAAYLGGDAQAFIASALHEAEAVAKHGTRPKTEGPENESPRTDGRGAA